MDIIDIANLNKFYLKENRGRNVVFEDFSLKIDEKNRFVSLTGPDGAGKSTLLKLLCAVEMPQSGKIKFAGFTPDSDDKQFVRSNGYLSQTLGLYAELSVWQNLEIFAGLKGLDLKANRDYLLEILDRVGLLKFKEYAAASLSGGMRQKLGLACAIAAKPRLLVLDEPTVGVDPLSRKELWAIVREYLEQSNAFCIFSTAYFDEAANADLTLILLDGKIIAQDTAQNITSGLKNQTFCIKSDDYQKIARNLMFKTLRFDEHSPILDICPRGGEVDILTSVALNLDELNGYLSGFLTEQKFQNLSAQIREPILEDAYIFHNKDEISQAKFQNEIKEFDREKVVINVKNVHKNFGSFTAVQDTNFDVKKGEIFGLLGPNGAGKTTTFRMICALLKMSGGEILINGEDLGRAKSSVRAQIGYVSQKFSLYKKLSCYQNLEYFGRSYGLDGQALKMRIDELLSDFGLERLRDEIGQNLPFGAQRNLSMACALVHRPSILFLDEATSGADPLSRRFFWNRINALVSSGVSVIVTTHFMEEAEYCDRFLIQDRGKILVLGAPNEVCVEDGKRVSVERAFINEVVKFREQNG